MNWELECAKALQVLCSGRVQTLMGSLGVGREAWQVRVARLASALLKPVYGGHKKGEAVKPPLVALLVAVLVVVLDSDLNIQWWRDWHRLTGQVN